MESRLRSRTTLVALVLIGMVGIAKAEFSEEQKTLMASLRKGCMEETGADLGTIEGCMKGNFPDDNKLKCYIKCTLVQMTVMDDDGLVDVDTLLTMMPEEMQEMATPILNSCKDARGGDACGNAFEFMKCVYNKKPDQFFMI